MYAICSITTTCLDQILILAHVFLLDIMVWRKLNLSEIFDIDEEHVTLVNIRAYIKLYLVLKGYHIQSHYNKRCADDVRNVVVNRSNFFKNAVRCVESGTVQYSFCRRRDLRHMMYGLTRNHSRFGLLGIPFND